MLGRAPKDIDHFVLERTEDEFLCIFASIYGFSSNIVEKLLEKHGDYKHLV